MRKLSFIIFVLSITSVLMAQSPHGGSLTIDCGDCHTPQEWEITTSLMKFKHESTGFILEGEHKVIDCASCHSTLVFSDAKPECSSCHSDVHQNTVGMDCARCHSPNSWVVTDITNLHNMSRFPLLGPHTKADCEQCHTTPGSKVNFEALGTDCYDCHRTNYIAAKNPDHVAGDFSKDCSTCHSPSSNIWNFSAVDHSFFPLVGGHAIANCFSCHTGGDFEEVPDDCYSCHSKDFNATTNPDHAQLNFSTDCQECHTLDPGWSPTTFDHDKIFPLTGAHSDVRNDCQKCHIDGNYSNTPTDCYSCHTDNYNATTNPPHIQVNFGTDCESCHSTSAWQPATFDHDGQFFPIYSGEHNGQWDACSDCHTDQNNYAVFSCLTCHEHNQTDTDSEHNGVNGYVYESTACLSCHPTGGGEGDGESPFNHANTAFLLTGSHVGLTCESCHTSGYTGTSKECESCHLSFYQNAVDPNHVSLALSTNCNDCHNTESWKPSTFDHIQTGFELTGKHTEINCADCHTGGVENTLSDCYDCHKDQFDSAPDHQSLGYPHTCDVCHNTNAWTPADFDHNKTNFPLTGAHVTTECASCHESGYTGTSSVCVDCHQTNYDNTTNPDHGSLGLSTDCAACHTTDPGWSPASFDVHDQYYQLVGAHANISNECSSCHTTGIYADAPTDCVGCHLTDYQNTTDPNHASANFPQTCLDCHTQNAWTPATFDHDGQYFPIYSGEHNGEWNACSDCHTNSNDYGVFSCIDCHEHNQTDMDAEHSGVNDYSYNSIACYDCHPNGTADDGDGGKNLRMKIMK